MNLKINNLSINRFKGLALLLMPILTICTLIWTVPFIYQVYITFIHFNLGNPQQIGEYSGLNNYIDSFSKDQFFVNSIITTFKFSSICLILEFSLGLIIALILIEIPQKLAQIVISFIILPYAIAPVIVGLIWYFQFNPDFGPFSYIMKQLKIMDQPLLGTKYAFFSISLVDIWQNTPFMILIFYSTLKAIPNTVLEALKLDRINYWFKFKKIYVGYVTPIILTAIFLRFLGLIKTFDTIYLLTRGGPGTVTETFSLYSQRLNYQELNFGLGSAQGVIINYVLIIIFSLIFKRLKRR